MSQPRGRYAGSRDSGQRQPRHPNKSASTRPRQPYVNAPARDSAQTASIFKTRSFQFLVDTVGAENIALGLGSNMARVAELTKGERFTPETAFHMETTLGLPHGFFDQPNPALAAETISRLKSPLDFIQTDDEPEAVSETPEPDFALSDGQQPYPETSLSEEAQMQKKATSGSPKAVRNSQNQMAEQPSPRAPQKGSPPKNRTSPAITQKQALALDDSAALQNIRRANLHVLTGRNGSKARLGVVMAMSGSNMAHRLYGKKRMDGAEANRFTERLGLPAGWLDTPHSEAEIPESVSRLLTPASRGRVSVEEKEPHAVATKDGVPGKRVDAKTRTGRARAGVPVEPESASPVPADFAAEKEPVAVSQRNHDGETPQVLASRSAEEGDADVPAPTPATPESLSAAAIPQQSAVSLPASATSLENLHGIAPIAEALIKTLAGKARTGRLDELKALQLLQQAVLL
ncbi:hypothetical protein [Paraburkholderia rhynchosiae]|uniref:Uncharacterized protein n=1 Tax=Paraburkholderia rhynchosiae TaxID=487049 RepID=A0A2N7VQB3_9BURK|nr:hypothetical protein [Paraburkholderia rhynchosiae]PMS19305.1 hypothetical protein C0Z16_35415 [Paraburkholderia rhynchosiae]CAB3742782.1 hypothetical protein LMG27174_06910 [Paraburkholderia rhynchosiae]